MTLTDVAVLLDVKPKTISQYLSESKQEPHPSGKPRRYASHPFPEPTRLNGKPVWAESRKAEILDWDSARLGQGVGGGAGQHKKRRARKGD